MNNPFKGFTFQIIERVITLKNANSLGRFETRGLSEFKPEYAYQDSPVGGSDYIVNAFKYAATHRAENKRNNVVYFVIETDASKTIF